MAKVNPVKYKNYKKITNYNKSFIHYIYVCVGVFECVKAEYASRRVCFEISLYEILPFICFGLY